MSKVGGALLSASGISTLVPPGWDAQIFRHEPDPGEVSLPILHLATVPLPSLRGDFGGGVVEKLGDYDSFVSLAEYVYQEDGELFLSRKGLPALEAIDFSSEKLERGIPGQGGCQYPFSMDNKRFFMLYVVFGSLKLVPDLLPEVAGMVSTIQIGEADSSPQAVAV